MNDEFKVVVKRVSKGRKTNVKVYWQGELIGERTSARPYQRCLVVRRNREWEIIRAMENVQQQRKQAEHYRRVAMQLQPDFGKAVNDYGFNSVDSYIRDGSYLQWAKGCLEAADKSLVEAHRIDLAQGPLPEFDKPHVASFHQGKAARSQPWQIFATVLSIPQI